MVSVVCAGAQWRATAHRLPSNSKYPSPVQFYGDHCTYMFHHPFQKARVGGQCEILARAAHSRRAGLGFVCAQIQMEMFYRDMSRVATRGNTLTFQVPRILGASMVVTFALNVHRPSHRHALGLSTGHFGKDYDHRNRKHGISIVFASGTDMAAFQAKVHPMVLAAVS